MLSTTKGPITASGAVLPKQLDTLKNVILVNGATVLNVNFRRDSVITGAVVLRLLGSAATTTDEFPLHGVKLTGGLFVEIVSGAGDIYLEME